MESKKVIGNAIVLLIIGILLKEFIEIFFPLIIGIIIGMLITIFDFLSGLKTWQKFLTYLEKKLE